MTVMRMARMQQTMRVVRPAARREVVPSGLLGMVVFVGTEVMFFAGLISAFTISKAGAPRDAWNLPAGQVLPLGPLQVRRPCCRPSRRAGSARNSDAA